MLFLVLVGVIIAVALIASSSNSSESRIGATASTKSNLSGFAVSFQDWNDQASRDFNGPKVKVIDCIEPGDGTAVCAFIARGQCRIAKMQTDPIYVLQAGKVGLLPSQCNWRNALKWVGTQQ